MCVCECEHTLSHNVKCVPDCVGHSKQESHLLLYCNLEISPLLERGGGGITGRELEKMVSPMGS